MSKISETTVSIGKVLEERLEKLISEREVLRKELSNSLVEPPRESYETVIELLDDFAEMPVEVKRRIAGEFISRVLLWEERIEIEWKF